MTVHRQSGFTMMELVVVMILIGIVAAMAAPRLVSWQTIDQLGFRDNLRAMLRHAHKLAMTQNRDVCVVLSSAAGTAAAVYGAANVCDPTQPVDDPSDGQPYTVTAPSGLALTAQTIYFVKSTGTLSPVPAGNPSVLNINIGALPVPTLTVHSETGFVACSTGSTLVC